MVKTSKRRIETIEYPVKVLLPDIEEGDCLKPNSCMIRVANERVLRQMDGKSNHHSKVDAGHIKFHWGGRHATADMPKVGKKALMDFDREDKARRKAKKNGEKFISKVEPFTMTVKATLGPKLTKHTKERMDQIYTARRKRVAEGRKEKRYTLRDRIVGFA